MGRNSSVNGTRDSLISFLVPVQSRSKPTVHLDRLVSAIKDTKTSLLGTIKEVNLLGTIKPHPTTTLIQMLVITASREAMGMQKAPCTFTWPDPAS